MDDPVHNKYFKFVQERAAEIMMRTGNLVTLDVAKQGAIYHGLAALLAQPSPVLGGSGAAGVNPRQMPPPSFGGGTGPRRMSERGPPPPPANGGQLMQHNNGPLPPLPGGYGGPPQMGPPNGYGPPPPGSRIPQVIEEQLGRWMFKNNKVIGSVS
jgi:hypothetical protein